MIGVTGRDEEGRRAELIGDEHQDTAVRRLTSHPLGVRFDRHALELDNDRLGVAAAVLVVVPGERRRLDADANAILAAPGHVPVAAVVVQPRMPEERLDVRADMLAVRVDERDLHLEAGHEPSVGAVADADLDMCVLVLGFRHSRLPPMGTHMPSASSTATPIS